MIVSAHQALFGEVNRGHGLLASSLPESTFRSTVQLITDLPGSAIHPETQWEPYVRGYKAGDYYAFSKTFPDPNASRPGMVFTHVLLFDLAQILQIDYIDEIFRLLPNNLSQTSDVSTLQVNITESTTAQVNPPGYRKVVSTLLTNPHRTVVWVGNTGFTQIIESLWANLWPSAREKLSFRISFSPQDLHDNPPTIVCVPESLANRWSHEPVVRITDEYTLNPSDEMYLAETCLMGLPEGEPVRKLQHALNAFSPDLATLRILGRSLDHLQKLDKATENVELARDLVRSLAKLAPSPSEGISTKQKAIVQLQELTSQGTAVDIRAIRNINLSPYANTSTFFAETITSWMNNRLFIESDRDPDAVAELLEVAFREFNSDWGKEIKAILIAKFQQWNDQIATSTWQWWRQRPQLVEQTEPYFPDFPIVEQTLVDQCPNELSPQLGGILIGLAQRRKWFSLHAAAHLALYPPLVAIKKHLAFDRSSDFEAGVRQLVKRLDAKTFLEAALTLGENRLLRFAGAICANAPHFLAELDLNSREWRIVWYESILVSKNPWQGINDPSKVMNEVLARLLQHLLLENDLLEKLGQTEYGDLTEYPDRSNIWQYMAPKVAAVFLEQTADSWLRQFSAKIQLDAGIEAPLKDTILNPSRLKHHVEVNQANLLSFTMRMFFTFTELSENQLCYLCLDSPNLFRSNVTQLDAYQLGQLIKQRNWKRAATNVYHLVQRDRFSQLKYALRECYDLLSWWDQGTLYLSGLLPEFKVSDKEWWTSLTQLAIELYPSGPNEQELWLRAGGDKSSIKISGNGRENWQDATTKLIYGGGGDKVSTLRILAEMSRDFPNNQQLKLLKQLFEKSSRYK